MNEENLSHHALAISSEPIASELKRVFRCLAKVIPDANVKVIEDAAFAPDELESAEKNGKPYNLVIIDAASLRTTDQEAEWKAKIFQVMQNNTACPPASPQVILLSPNPEQTIITLSSLPLIASDTQKFAQNKSSAIPVFEIPNGEWRSDRRLDLKALMREMRFGEDINPKSLAGVIGNNPFYQNIYVPTATPATRESTGQQTSINTINDTATQLYRQPQVATPILDALQEVTYPVKKRTSTAIDHEPITQRKQVKTPRSVREARLEEIATKTVEDFHKRLRKGPFLSYD